MCRLVLSTLTLLSPLKTIFLRWGSQWKCSNLEFPNRQENTHLETGSYVKCLAVLVGWLVGFTHSITSDSWVPCKSTRLQRLFDGDRNSDLLCTHIGMGSSHLANQQHQNSNQKYSQSWFQTLKAGLKWKSPQFH